MSFNKNSIKRISSRVGIPRVTTNLVNSTIEWERALLESILKRATIILHFANRKTLQCSDLNLLSKFFSDIPYVFSTPPDLLTTEKSFRNLVRNILDEIDPDIRCSAHAVKILQYFVENQFIQKLKNNNFINNSTND